jgi:hypothetical protein
MEDNINAWISKLRLAGEKGGADTKKLLMGLAKKERNALVSGKQIRKILNQKNTADWQSVSPSARILQG